MSDVTKAISARSDQQNADDFLAGPRTIKIRNVTVKSTNEQPVSVFFDGDDGKPWKPSKTGLRCLAAIWGADSSKWVGLHCTLYNDPDVTWAGVKVGGIRVSHMEGIDSPRTLALNKAKGKKGVTVIHPLVINRTENKPEPHPPAEINLDQLRSDMAAHTNDPEGKRNWWGGLSQAEREAVKAMAAAQ